MDVGEGECQVTSSGMDSSSGHFWHALQGRSGRGNRGQRLVTRR